MTRRLGGIGQRSLTVLATFSLAATLAGGLAMVGCGGDSNPSNDGGEGDGKADVTVDAGVDTGTMIDTGKADTNPPCPTIAPPTFMPATGATVTLGSTVTIVPPAMPAGATVFYTLDSTLPVVGSPGTKVYSGPIQLGMLGSATINAVAAVQNSMCPPSVLAAATYTVATGDGGSGPPIFTPPSVTQSNDFLVSLTSGMATTVCFTTDGTTPPTCDKATGKCTGTSQTYNAGAGLGAAGSVTINGGVTNAATGKVTVQALACTAGSNPSATVSQTYTLQTAAATMQGPAPGNLTFNTMGYLPTMGSATNGATLRFTTDGSPATCATGTLLVTGIIGTPANPGALPVRKNITFHGVACKPGYAPSADAAFGYTVTLAPMPFVDSTSVAPGALIPESTGTYDRTFTTSTDPTPDTYVVAAGAGNPAGPAAGLYACVTTNGMTPACAMAANTCTTGTFTNILGGVAPKTIAITTTGEVVKSVSCSPNFNPSEVATATYTLQLDAPGLFATAGTAGPGCTPAVGVVPAHCYNASTGIITSYTLPPGPTDFAVEEWIGKPPPSAVAQPQYAFACAAKGVTPVCAAAGCTVGTSIAGADFQSVAAPTLASAGITVVANDSWSVVGCPGSVSPAFTPSVVSTITFSAAGAAKAPSITPASATFNSQISAAIMNQDPTVGSYICWINGTVAAPPVDPVCSAGACTTGTFNGAVTPFGTSTVTAVGLAPGNTGGTGYTSAPAVTIAAPPAGTQAVYTATVGFSVASYTIQSAGSGCPANLTAIIGGGTQPFGGTVATAKTTVSGASNVLTSIIVGTTGGSGYAAGAPPTVTFAGACTTDPVVVANLATTGSVVGFTAFNAGTGYGAVPAVTLTGGGGSGAVATAQVSSALTDGPLQVDATVVKARACLGIGGTVTQSPVVTETYNFKDATPTVADGTAAPTINLVTGSNFQIGNTLSFQEPPQTPAAFSGPAPFMCVTFDGTTPDCTCTPGTYVRKSTAAGPPGSAWTFAGTTASEIVSSTTFSAGTSTVKAVACDANQQTSDVMTATLTLQEQVPVMTPVGGGTPGTGTVRQNITGVMLTSSGATNICYTTSPGATLDCTPGAAAGTGCLLGSTYIASGGTVTVQQSGTDIKAIACNATTKSAVSADNYYTMNVTPPVLVNNPGSMCSTTQKIGLDCALGAAGATSVCSTATSAAGGPTANAILCYSVDGTAVTACQAPPGTGTGGASGPGIHCFSTGALGTTTATLTLTANATVNAYACLTGAGVGFNPSSATLPVTFTPYAFTPLIDGSLVDWNQTAPTNIRDNTATPSENSTALGPPITPTRGYFSFDATNYYFAYAGSYAPAASTFVTLYIGDNAATGGTTLPLPTQNCATGAPIYALAAGANVKYAVTIETDTSAATTYAFTGGAWAAGAFTATAKDVGGNIEVSVPRSALSALAANHVTVLGAVVTNVGLTGSTNCAVSVTPVTTTDTWPEVGAPPYLPASFYAHYYNDNTASCTSPNATLL